MIDLKRLEDEIKNLPKEYIVLIETTPEKIFEVSTFSLKFLSEKNKSGIVVSANRPYSNLVDVYKRNDIDVSKMFILDCISKNLNGHRDDIGNVMFMENLSSLTDISLSIHEKIKNGSTFVFFDSINTMLIHNKPYIFARFIHNVLTKMRLNNVGGILISLQDNSNREIRAEIAQLCDKVIKI